MTERFGRRSVRFMKPPGFDQGATMHEKSRPQHNAKKVGKTLKQKRAEKHAKAEAKEQHIEIVPRGKKH